MTPPKPETISYKSNSTKSTYRSFPSQKAQCLSIVLRNPVVITCVHMAKEFPVLTDHLCSVISKLTVLEEVMRKKKHAVSTWRCQLKPIFSYTAQRTHIRPENLKSPGQKRSWNQKNQFHEKKFFWPNSVFCNFKNGQKSIFELGKSLKLAKM